MIHGGAPMIPTRRCATITHYLSVILVPVENLPSVFFIGAVSDVPTYA